MAKYNSEQPTRSSVRAERRYAVAGLAAAAGAVAILGTACSGYNYAKVDCSTAHRNTVTVLEAPAKFGFTRFQFESNNGAIADIHTLGYTSGTFSITNGADKSYKAGEEITTLDDKVDAQAHIIAGKLNAKHTAWEDGTTAITIYCTKYQGAGGDPTSNPHANYVVVPNWNTDAYAVS